VGLLMASVELFGMNRWVFVFVFGMILVGLVSGASVDDAVFSAFENGEEKVRVIVEKNDFVNPRMQVSAIAAFDDFEKITENENGFTAYVSLKEFERMKLDSGISNIRLDFPLKIFMQNATGILNANDSWNLKVDGVNLTGSSGSVCILDTGIDNGHGDFTGRILKEKCFCSISDSGSGGCCPDGTVEDDSAIDNHGHGTHVAGIVGAHGGLNGVAINVGLVIVKIMNGTGDGTSSDMENAIQWCINNADTYNISVISASLGDASTGYNLASQATCDSRSSGLTEKITAANSANISVVIASGNENRNNGISWPSCISTAIPVGATDKADAISSYSNRGNLLKLLGIGGGTSGSTRINSTCFSGDPSYNNGYCLKYGTSMATPMVAGAIAIINQFLNLGGRIMTPVEIEDVLYDTGKNISELGNDYSRINIYDALLSLDNIGPDVSLVSPLNNNINLSLNQSFICNASDWQLANVTFRIWNSSGVYYNGTQNLSGTTNETNFNLIDLPKGEYVWNCFVEDVLGNFGSAADNFSLTIGEIVVDLNSPVNESYTNVNVTNFSCLARTDVAYELANISFRIWNSSGDLIRNESRNISGLENTTNFSYTFLEEDDYLWGCVALNNNSDVGDGVNFSIEYDVSLPVISDLSVDASTSSAVISWTTDEVSNSSVWMSGGTWSNSSEYATNHSISISGLSSSTGYTYVVRSCDKATNCVNSSGSFTTDAQSSSGGGGGGSSSGVKVIEVRPEEIFMGKSFLIGVNDKISFNLPSGSHSLTVSKVGKDYAEIVVMSEPLNLNLSVREEVKLNLSSSNYYDLAIRLNGISNRKANVSVMRIFEIIEVPEVLQKENDTSITPISPVVRDDEIQDFYFYKLLFVALVVISGGVILWVLKSNEEDRLARKNARIRERARRKMRKEKDEELKKELKRLGLKI